MLREQLSRQWVFDLVLASPERREKIVTNIKEFRDESDSTDRGHINEYYKQFYCDLNERISIVREHLNSVGGVFDQRRFAFFQYDAQKTTADSVEFGTLLLRNCSYESQIGITCDNAIIYAAACLRLVELIEGDVEREVGLYTAFDRNENKFWDLKPSIELLGGRIYLWRPLVEVTLPTSTNTARWGNVERLGYQDYELTGTTFDYERLEETVRLLQIEADARRDRIS